MLSKVRVRGDITPLVSVIGDYWCIFLSAEYQNHEDARHSEHYIQDLEKLDTALLPKVCHSASHYSICSSRHSMFIDAVTL